MKKGKFIVIDGEEGAGKSSQLKKIKEIFGDDVVVTREPGGSPYAEEIRKIILNSTNADQADARTHFALFWAARRDHIRNNIQPALNAGKIVISDRFDSSTYAYQIFGQEAQELKPDFFFFRDFFIGDCKPDLYIHLSVDVEEGLRRKQNDDDSIEINHFDKRKVDFHRRMKAGFEEFMAGDIPSVIIDANPPFDEVHKALLFEIQKAIQ